MLKSLLKFASHPLLLAGVGGTAAYFYLGQKRSGKMPYLIAGGGALAGYLAGHVAQKYLTPVAALPAATANGGATDTAASTQSQIDWDDPKIRGTSSDPRVAQSQAQAQGYAEYADGDLGSLSPSTGFNADEIDIDGILGSN